jgi:AcrR family transcriptional regulator
MAPGDDWVLGGDRSVAAAERIYDAAADLIAREGLDALDIDRLAAVVHCSRATIYRHVGGKSDIRDVVVRRAAIRVTSAVLAAVQHLAGRERLVTAMVMSLQRIRGDPLSKLLVGSIRRGSIQVNWLAESPLLDGFAADLTGLAGGDPEAAKWIVRVMLSLMFWPAEDDDTERRIVERFVAPVFSEAIEPGLNPYSAPELSQSPGRDPAR